jgi:hypothetical protein
MQGESRGFEAKKDELKRKCNRNHKEDNSYRELKWTTDAKCQYN